MKANRFRFRAWCPEGTFTDSTPRMQNRDVGKNDPWFLGGFGFIIMQSTGLADKNGVEIFEGDVVRVTYGLADEERSYTTVVSWDEELAGFEFTGDPDIKASYEVLGNQYEHPHLLK